MPITDISLTDPDARHGHKTDRQTFEGFKLHLLGDVVSGLITTLTVTRGNVHDGKVAHRLVRRAKYLHEHISQVLGDTAYGAATLRHQLQAELKVTLVAPPPHNGGSRTLGRESIVIDFDAQTATRSWRHDRRPSACLQQRVRLSGLGLSMARRDLPQLQDGREL